MFAYNRVNLRGQGLVDYVWIKNKIDTQAEIEETNEYTYRPSWDGDTIFLANFDNNIDAGNAGTVSGEILYWQIYKRIENESALRFIGRVPASQHKLYDFNVLNNSTYKYILFGETAQYISTSLQQEGETTTNWWNWSLTKIRKADDESDSYYVDSGNVWLFDTELQSSALQQNLDKAVIENFTQFPKVSTGKKNYLTGSISAYLSNPYNSRYQDTVEQYNAFIDFIADENPKLLKDRKGNGWIVATTGNQMQYEDVSSEQITVVSFEFVQLGDLDDVSIIGG